MVFRYGDVLKGISEKIVYGLPMSSASKGIRGSEVEENSGTAQDA
jgi:hypothetical protein